ncbi:MAG: ADP-ribosylglycohydrolase family protein [Anaerolineales bacterium]|nr:ADP-ribosylglycohydrolase family protein [Anaerolineales bacterium]
MIGAIAGDIIGSAFEGRPTKEYNFPLFSPRAAYTDETVMTVATAWALLNDSEYGNAYKNFGRRYPMAGYGEAFFQWLMSEVDQPYFSWSNHSAMRVSPIAYAFNTDVEVLEAAKRSAEVTHNHPEGIKGAQAVALAVFRARKGKKKAFIKEEIEFLFNYDLERSLAQIRPNYTFHTTCQHSVPESIIAFLESENLEDAIRKVISLGGDSDTMACITGAIAHAYYKQVPKHILREVNSQLPDEFLEIIKRFNQTYGLPK